MTTKKISIDEGISALDRAITAAENIETSIDKLFAENAKLKADNKRLRDAAREVDRYWNDHDEYVPTVIHSDLKAALAGDKP